MLLFTCLLLLGCGSGQDNGFGPGPGDRARPANATTTTLTASRDGDISGNHPNRNRGAFDSMEVARPVRSLVAFDQAGIAAAVGAGTLKKATLRLTIGLNEDNWGPQGRTVGVHRMRRAWAEAGVTWQCSDDAMPGNQQQDCAGAGAWDMTTPDPALWKGAPTDEKLVTNGLRGVVEFDVTADVAAFLAGTANHGWIVRKADEEGRGRIAFLTRESVAGPQLVLKVAGAASDTSRPPIPEAQLPGSPSLLFENPASPGTRYFGEYFGIMFKSDASGSAIRAVLATYRLTVVGGISGLPGIVAYYVKTETPPAGWEELDALLGRIATEASVDLAFRVEYGSLPVVRGRWPVDSLVTSSRESWFGIGATADQRGTIASFRAIRAPLAWGCETGAYGGVLPPIAVLDYFFDVLDPDLNVAKLWLPTLADTLIIHGPTTIEREHGLGVAAVAAAIGDNGRGMSGVAWGAPLHLSAFSVNNLTVSNLLTPLVATLRDAITSGVPVLSLSTSFGAANDTTGIGAMQRLFRAYLEVSPKNVIVLALPHTSLGGRGSTLALGQVISSLPPGVLASEVALARLAQAGFANRIIFVGGTVAATGVRWLPSDIWTGGSTVAGPSDGILTLSPSPSGQPVYGTSFAAPMVAGTAALLWAMAPDLTGAEVVRLILEGAAEDQVDPLTGMTSSKPDIGVPGVYQLDVYSSLKRLARERRDTPICGFPVVTRAVQDPQTGATLTSVVLSRPGQGEQEVFRGAVANITVAQGGRRIGIDDFGSAREVEFRNGTWQATSARDPRYDAFRQFLERDTAFVSYSGDVSTGPSVWLEGLSGSGGPFMPCAGLGGFVPANVRQCSLGAIAKSGDWIHAVIEGDNYDVTGCGAGRAGYGSYLAPLRGGAARILREAPYDPCAGTIPGTFVMPHVDVLAWRADGAVAWVGQSSGTYLVTQPEPDSLDPFPLPQVNPSGAATVFRQQSVVTGVPALNARTVENLTAFALGWMADGSTLISYDAPIGFGPPCVRTVRASLAPERDVSASPLPGCLGVALEPLPANLRTASAQIQRTHPGALKSSLLRSPMDRWLKAVRRRSTQRVVVVN